jgi:hypothetical protein
MRTIGFIVAGLAALATAGSSLAVAPSSRPSPVRTIEDTAEVDRWPMPVDKFLAGKYLERADVVLTRRDYDLTSFAIRWATQSPFSHAAMIFTGPQHEPGIASTFVIEAGTSGVDLTNLKDYVAEKTSFVAVKRLRREWFDAPMQARARGVLLERIKASYNYWAIGRLARNIWFGVQNTVRGRDRTLQAYRDRDWQPPNEFICSGLVQFGFVEAIVEAIRQGQLPLTALNDVVFRGKAEERIIPRAALENLRRQPDMTPEKWRQINESLITNYLPQIRYTLAAELEATTPDDLARSEKLDWMYLIKEGLVHKVASQAEVEKLLQ